MSLWTILAARSAKQPNIMAVLSPNRLPLPYGQLPNCLESIRAALNGFGIGRGDVVAIALPDDADTAVCMLGVLCCAIAAPLNPNYTDDEFASCLKRLRPKAIIVSAGASQSAQRQAGALGIPVIQVATDRAKPIGALELSSNMRGAPTRPGWNEDEDVAALMFTSGTMGKPKIIPYSCNRLAAYVSAFQSIYRFSPSDRSLNVMPFFHGHGLRANLIGSVLCGSGVVCPGRFDVATFFACLEEFRPTWYSAGYSVHHAILDQIENFKAIAKASRLRFIRSGSGALHPRIIRGLEEGFGAPVCERYGGTETAEMTYNPLPPAIRKPGTVGIVTASAEVRIIDAAGHFLGSNQEGEVVGRGPMVFEGYWDDPEATAAAFTDGWFSTGDLGRFDDDGYLTITGRIKDVINRGGEKISPMEVESALLAHPAIAEACVFPVPHPTLGQELCAAIVTRSPGTFDEAELLAECRRRLTPFKVPRKIFVLDSLPKTDSGKLQRTAMAQVLGLGIQRASERRNDDNPVRIASALETALAGLWASLLKQHSVALEVDFFLLGGDSLSAVNLLGQVQEAFGICLPFAAIFDQASTVVKMARCIEAARRHGGGTAATTSAPYDSGIQRRDPAAPCPVSFQQRRLWFIDRLHPGSATYNVDSTMRPKGPLDIEAMTKAINGLIARHEALRTTFTILDGEPCQIVSSDLRISVPVRDIRDLPCAERMTEARRLLDNEARRPFDLERGPLIRALLVRLTDTETALFFVHHHIVTDAWSRGIFERELFALYDAFVVGNESPLPDLRLQYPDYAAWQRRYLSGKRLDDLLAYWRNRLEGAPRAVAIPTDHRRNSPGDLAGSRLDREMPSALITGFSELARKEKVSLYFAGLTAFNAFLHRYSGEEDIVVGVPVQGRERAETLGIIGFFLNMLPVRSDVSGNPTFRELLGRVRKAAAADLAHHHLPFERMVEDLQPDRRPGETPLFNTSFVMLDLRNRINLDDDFQGLDTGTAPFDLSVVLSERKDGTRLTFRYNSALFEKSTIERMMSHFVRLLEGVVESPDRRISEIPLLTPDERHEITTAWNQTHAEFPRDASLQKLFEAQADASPHTIAVSDGATRVTYAELDAQANGLAHFLQNRGVAPHKTVGICLKRSIDFIVAILAILKTGAAYLPLETNYPEGRKKFILADANATHVLTRSEFMAAGECGSIPVVFLDTVRAEIAAAPSRRPSSRTAGGDLAYIIYTSGSTGQPKGVAVLQSGVSRLVINTNYLSFSSGTVIAHISSVAFDAATFEVWGALLNGGRLEIFDEETVLRPDSLAEAISARRITAMFMTTALFHQTAQAKPDAFAGLDTLLVGGETIDPVACNRVLGAVPPKRLVNIYGPTETTTFAAFHEIRRVPGNAASIPIGRPIANTRLYIVSPNMQPVPIGVPGELHIGGPGVARGYVNLPELTSKRFILDAFSDQPGALLYKTGDRARFLPGGSIELLGRFDRQIKMRGFRVEPAEIEAALLRHPLIAQAAVGLTEGQRGDQHLSAHLVKRSEDSVSSSELRTFLKATLPGYMIPDSFIWLDRLPLTASGKLDRSAVHNQTPHDESATVAPRTATERIVASIWAEHLGLESIGIEDDFFELGGHSLLAVTLILALESRFEVTLPLTLLFGAPTVAAISKAIEKRIEPSRQIRIIAIQPNGRKTPIFAIPGGGGSAISYGLLARGLGGDQPFYGLEHAGLDDGEVPPDQIESVAAIYAEDILRQSPADQPCILLGACSGAIVALELARLLAARQRRVDYVIMLDPSPTGTDRRRAPTPKLWRRLLTARFIVGRLTSYAKEFRMLNTNTRKTFLREKLRVLSSIVQQRKLSRDAARELRQTRIREATITALHNYTPRPYAGTVALLLGERFHSIEHRELISHWMSAIAGSCDILRIPGRTTGDMLKQPIVGTLVRQIQDILDRPSSPPGARHAPGEQR